MMRRTLSTSNSKDEKKIIKRVIQWISILTVFIIIFLRATSIIVPKYLYDDDLRSPETEMWDALYAEEPNSIDVIFLGNSHIYCGINPIVFYEKTGLTSFVLSTSAQDCATGYYILREALKTQKPSYVVVDLAAFTNDWSEPSRSFANMKLSMNKIDAIKSFEYTKDDNESILSYYLSAIFPLNYYHSRWDSLNKNDFDYSEAITSYNGYVRTRDTYAAPAHANYYDNEQPYEYSERTLEYFPKIKELCDDNNIEIIVSCAPYEVARVNDYTCFVNYMSLYGLTPYEFNSSPNYENIGLIPEEDYRDENHMNEYGAAKFTSYMASVIWGDKKEIIEHTDKIKTIWEEKQIRWQQDTKNRNLKQIERLPEYIKAVLDSDYITLISYNEHKEPGDEYCFQDDVRDILSNVGCVVKDVNQNNRTYTASFSLILDEGFPNYDTKYNYGDDIFECKVENEHCILAVNRQDYSLTDKRLNIVVYSKSQKKVIDSCYFDLIYSLNVLRE